MNDYPAGAGSDWDRRQARRDFIRTHHPDAGGDHEAFVAGLAAFDARPRPGAPGRTPPVTVVPRQSWPVSLTTVMLRRLRRRHQQPRVR